MADSNWIIFSPWPNRGLGEARFQDRTRRRPTRRDGSSSRACRPGRASIRAQLGPWQESPLTSSESVPLELAPGEHREIVLGGNGITVHGQVNATGRGDVELNKNWSLNYLIRRDVPEVLSGDYSRRRAAQGELVPEAELRRLDGAEAELLREAVAGRRVPDPWRSAGQV